MVWFRRVYIPVAVITVLTILTVPASAQAQVTYSLAGVETAATSTQGTFVGVAKSADDIGTFGAVVLHDPLSDPAPSVTGGSFAIDGQLRDLQGVITGGQIERQGGSCRKETFTVTGQVLLANGLGQFEVTLTHYGTRVLGGGCVTFFATIEGLITFTLTP